MRGPEGGFYSSLDADSEGEEGKFYLWTRKEILNVLGAKDGDAFCHAYNASEAGNYLEQSTRAKNGKNIFHLDRPVEDAAKAAGTTPAALTVMRAKLLAIR